MALVRPGSHHYDGSSNADRGVPTFSGTITEFREYRKRADIYLLKNKIMSKTDQEIGLSLMSGLTGAAWDVVEHIDVLSYTPTKDKDFEGEAGLVAKIFKELDAAFRYDKRTELPNAFEDFFFKGGRRPRESLLEYFTRVQKITRNVKEHGIEMPDEVQGWLLLRRAGLKREDRLMIMSRIGDMKLATVTQALTFTYGQDSTPDVRTGHKGSGKGHNYYVDEPAETDVNYQDDGWEYEDIDYAEEAEDVHWVYDENFDSDQSYYGNSGTIEADYDTGEYDEVFANYTDARKRMNDLRLARGFFPVVALGPDGQTSAVGATAATKGSTPSTGAPTKGKGKQKGTKGKSKGKPTTASSTATGPSSAKGRAASARGDSTCLRCGQPGHWARNCPKNPQGMKRGREEEATIAMVSDQAGRTHRDDDVAESRMGMLDGGASTMVVGATTLWRYITYLLQRGIDVRDIDCFTCSKWLRFGNDQSQECKLGSKVPMVCGSRVGVVFCYILPGETPFLIARPVMEQLGLSIDFGDKKIKWPGQTWQDASLGHTGNYLIDLCDDIQRLQNRRYLYNDAFDLVPDDNSIDFTDISRLADHGYRFPTVVPEPHRPEAHEDPAVNEDLLASLTCRQLHDVIHAVEETLRRHHHDLKHSKKVVNNRRKCWEVFVGEGRTSAALQQMGADVRSFGPQTGWNFMQRKDRVAFMNLLHNETPDEVFLSPTCAPWSSIQELNLCRPDTAAKIIADRELHHRTILKFVADVYETQRREGRHAHVEQPKQARSWLTYHYRRMKGYNADFDQCRYGLTIPNVPGVVKKPTTVRTTKWQMAVGLAAKCECTVPHAELMGNVPGTSQARTSYAENYPYQLANRIAELMMEPDVQVNNYADDIFPIDDLPPDDLNDLHPAPDVPTQVPPPEPEPDHNPDPEREEEDKAMIHRHRQLQLKYGSQVFQYVKKLHIKMGHPSTFVLARMLKDSQAPDAVVRCAAEYSCQTCLKRSHPASPAKTAIPVARTFNDYVYLDIMYIDAGQDKCAILSAVDAATRYMMARMLKHETSKDLIKALTRGWIRLFGAMKQMMFDEGTNFCSDAFKQWAESHGIRINVAPPEAHHRMGPVERRHAVLRESLEKYMENTVNENPNRAPGPKLLQEALCFVPSQINSLAYTRGYSSTQWVLGYQPMDISSLTHDQYSPAAQDAADGNDDFYNHLQCRARAALSFIKADASQRLRRALQRRYRSITEKPVVGQTIYYWRSQGSGRLQKSRWRGPATVVQIETSGELDRPMCYWIVHGTSLLRCAPEHIRSDVRDHGTNVMENLAHAKDELRKVKGRGVTQYIDLRRQRVRPDESDNDMPVDEPPMTPYSEPGPSPAIDEESLDNNWWNNFLDTNIEDSDAATSAVSTPRASASPSSPMMPTNPASSSGRVVRPRMNEPAGQPQSEPSAAASVAPSVSEQIQNDLLELFGDLDTDPDMGQPSAHDIPIPEDHVDIELPIESPSSPTASPGPMTTPPLGSRSPTLSSGTGPSSSSASRTIPTEPTEGAPGPIRRTQRRVGRHPYLPHGGVETRHHAEDITMVHDDVSPPPEGWRLVSGEYKFHLEDCKAVTELSWRTMTPHDRALFLVAKIKELKSFFDNGVWEFVDENQADPKRTLKARFLLKWSKDDQGMPRAKARLVIQGFNDPDVLEGKLTTSSPTASRVSKMVMLAIAACKRWRPWTADVSTAFLQGKEQERKLYVKLPAEALNLLGASPNTRMLLNKPCYGQADAPRRWWMEADSRLKRLGLLPHPLDPCLYLSFDANTELDGMISLHVDDMLGAGDAAAEGSPSWRQRITKLRLTFQFREWKDNDSLEYCGAEIEVKSLDGGFTLRHANYAKKLKPITIDKHRVSRVDAPVTEAELKQLRGLLCSLQWPATQSCPHLQASVSILMGQITKATIQTALDANKTLRFFKTNSDVGLDFFPILDDLNDAAFVTMTDAAWGVRADGSSQSGHLVFLVHKSVLDGQVGRYVLIDWKSSRTPRMSRSSLNSEAQAAATGVDAMEHVLATWSLCRYPNMDPRADDTLKVAGPSALVLDAKSLYDALGREHMNSITDKRTGIELMVIKERLAAMGAVRRWQSSERQYADGMTKMSGRQLLADRLRCGEMLLVHDATFQAAKKKTSAERQQSTRAHAKAKTKTKNETQDDPED